MSITVPSVVLEVSSQLNDQGQVPYARWPQSALITYLNDALIQVGNFRPDAFTMTVPMTLGVGALQSLPAGYSQLKSLDSNSDASNCPGAPITEANLDILRAFFKKPCLPTGGAANYRVTSFAYDLRNPLVYYVSPPVPATSAGLQLIGTMIKDAPQYTTADFTSNTTISIEQKYRNALIAWMLYRAYEVDTESVSSRQSKLDNEGIFWKTLGIDYKQQSLYNSGYYLGQKGLKDPAPSRH